MISTLVYVAFSYFSEQNDKKNNSADEVKSNSADEVAREKQYISKIKFAEYSGRLGATFIIPSDWDVWIDPIFASMGKVILHPANPEIGVQYFDYYAGPDYDQEGKGIEEIADEECERLKKEGYKIITLTFFKRESKNCGDKSEFYKIKYQKRNERGVDKTIVRICTIINNFEYNVSVFAPDHLFPEYELLFLEILSSVKIDCKGQEEFF